MTTPLTRGPISVFAYVMLTELQTAELLRLKGELAQLDARLSASHLGGDSQSSQGISATWTDNRYWQRRADHLRMRIRQLEALRDGEPLPAPPGVTLVHYRSPQHFAP